MADRQEQSTTQAWANFAASGSVTDYLRYRALENRADATTSTSGGNKDAKPGTHAARRANQGKRPPDHGAY